MKISIVIPAYNAGQTIEDVIDRIPESVYRKISKIWIVDDGSTDNTGKITDALAENNELIESIHLLTNSGYGKAMKTGLDAARLQNPDVIVCLHSDGQYAPESLPALVQVMDDKSLDILQGSRLARGKKALAGGMPIYKYLAGMALVRLENRVFELSMTDYHSGYILYSRRALSVIDYRWLSDSFDFDLEMIASARAHGLSIGEHPIPTTYANEVSHLKPIRYGLRVLRVLIEYKRGKYHACMVKH